MVIKSIEERKRLYVAAQKFTSASLSPKLSRQHSFGDDIVYRGGLMFAVALSWSRSAVWKSPAGEISPRAVSGICELHNQTMTVTTIAEVAA